MAVLDPVRLDHVKRTLRTIVRSAVDDVVPADQVVWTEQGIPRGPRPLVALTLLEGPIADGTIQDEHVQGSEVTSVDYTVDSAVALSAYKARINGIPYDVTSVGGPTVDTIRDQLVALINNTIAPLTKQSEPVTAAAGGPPGTFSITPDSAGAIYSAEASPAGLLSRVINSDPSLLTTHLIGRERMLFQIDVMFVGGVAIELSARMLAARIRKAFDLPSNIEITGNARVPIQVASTIRDLTALEPGGAKFESRASFDVLAFISSRIAESTVPIDVVEVTTSIDGNLDTFTVTAP